MRKPCLLLLYIDIFDAKIFVYLGGYKGYGLGALVEIFCGILSGSHWGPNVRKWLSTSAAADLVTLDSLWLSGYFKKL